MEFSIRPQGPFDLDLTLQRYRLFGDDAAHAYVDGVYQRALQAGATIVTKPFDWTVPGHDGKTVNLRSISLFDPNGIYLEISQR